MTSFSDTGSVIYWMQVAQRADDNPALNEAVRRANDIGAPVVVYFGLDSGYPSANARHYAFMLDGLRETQAELAAAGIPLVIRTVNPVEGLAQAAVEFRAVEVITEIGPLRHQRKWREDVRHRLKVPFTEITTETVVPVDSFGRLAATAAILRPFIHRALSGVEWEQPRPRVNRPLTGFQPSGLHLGETSTDQVLGALKADRSVPLISAAGSPVAAGNTLKRFVTNHLERYADDHVRAETSRLSAHLHFGQIGPRTVARAVYASDAPQAAKDAFLEQLLVRRELAHNFCWFNPDYDRYEGIPEWGRKSLEAHAGDPRTVLYTRDQLEAAETHDDVWNLAQRQMVETGRMHNYLRMVWAKKILEWSETPREAFDTAVYLNDKYELDGRDPNGYTGIAWSIGGRHDRPWPARPVYGVIRYMSTEATRRKMGIPRDTVRGHENRKPLSAQHVLPLNPES